MKTDTLPRPEPSEYAEYYGRYIDRVPNGDILQLMQEQIEQFAADLGAIPENQANVLHPPYTWTIKQVVGHLIDVEKVFGYRAHRFACNDLRPILGMEQNEFVDNLDYDLPALSDLAVELKCARRSNLLFLRRLPMEAWNHQASADGNTISVRAIAYILVGHIIHHLDIINERVT